MPHVIEPASSGRAKCRGCGETIAAGTLRFGEALPNPFAEGETKHWFHLECASFKRPEPFLEALESRAEPLDDRDVLEREARLGLAHRRLPRVDGAERSHSGRAQCRSCRQAIEKGEWRIRLVFYEEGRFSPSGYVHPRCALAYFETVELAPRLRRFSKALSGPDLAELQTWIRNEAS